MEGGIEEKNDGRAFMFEADFLLLALLLLFPLSFLCSCQKCDN